MSLSLLYAAHPFPPANFRTLTVGNSPIVCLNHLPQNVLGPALQALNGLGINPNRPLNRNEVRTICRDLEVPALAKYACIMAWGGSGTGRQTYNFLNSLAAPNLPNLITSLVNSTQNRAADFQLAKTEAAQIPGLGISYYTKLLFFLRPQQDAYILDQWTGKSTLLLTYPSPIRLTRPTNNGFCQADPDTTLIEYENFCRFLELLANRLWPGVNANGEDAEMAIFDEPGGFWRTFVRSNYEYLPVGRLLVNGAESLTTVFDFRFGLFGLRDRDGQHLFVRRFPFREEWDYRFLLGRIHELSGNGSPLILYLPGNNPLPQWFVDALQNLCVTVERIDDQDGGQGEGGGGRVTPPPAPLFTIRIRPPNNVYFPIRRPNQNSNIGYVCKNDGRVVVYQELQQQLEAADAEENPLPRHPNQRAPYGQPPNQLEHWRCYDTTHYREGEPTGDPYPDEAAENARSGFRFLMRYFNVIFEA